MFHYDDSFNRFRVGTALKFTWFPKRCHFTGKILWMKFAYKQTAMYSGPGDVIFEERWYDKKEFLIAKLKEVL